MRGTGDNGTQLDRLLAAIVSVSCRYGYEDTTIARVISDAGVSRTTFYEHFANKEACFVAALEPVQRDVLAAVERSIEERPPQIAAAAAITALVSFAQARPAESRLLMHESMAAGRSARAARDNGVEQVASLIEDAYRHLNGATPVPAIPPEILIGACFRLLAWCLVRGEQALTALQGDLLDWLEAYRHPVAARRWRTLTPAASPASSPILGRAPLRAPPALPPGRPRHAAAVVSEIHRLRIIFATAETVRRDGYAAATVAEITRAAGVDGRIFYRLFAGKREAFSSVRELTFQNAMAVTAGAFFAEEQWPQRVWQAGAALTQYLQESPALSYACVVESHSGGTKAAQRLQELLAGFTIFLQEGYGYQHSHASTPSQLALEAVAQANLEIVYRQMRRDPSPELTGLLAHLVYMSLAPFVGVAHADELIAAMANGGAS